MPALMPSMSGVAQLKTAWKMRNITIREHDERRRPDAAASASIRPSQTAFARRRISDRGEHAAHVRLGLLRIFRAGLVPLRRVHHAMSRPAGWLDGFDECIGAAAFHRDGRQHRHAELAREPRDVDVHAAASCDVHAIEREHHRQAEALHLEREAQADRQVHCIDDADHEIRRAFARNAPEQDVAGDRLVERRGLEAVRAGQIEDAQMHCHQRAARSPSRRSTVTPG